MRKKHIFEYYVFFGGSEIGKWILPNIASEQVNMNIDTNGSLGFLRRWIVYLSILLSTIMIYPESASAVWIYNKTKIDLRSCNFAIIPVASSGQPGHVVLSQRFELLSGQKKEIKEEIFNAYLKSLCCVLGVAWTQAPRALKKRESGS